MRPIQMPKRIVRTAKTSAVAALMLISIISSPSAKTSRRALSMTQRSRTSSNLVPCAKRRFPFLHKVKYAPL